MNENKNKKFGTGKRKGVFLAFDEYSHGDPPIRMVGKWVLKKMATRFEWYWKRAEKLINAGLFGLNYRHN